MEPKSRGKTFRSRVFLSFLAAFLPVIALTVIGIETLLVPYVEEGVWEDLSNSTKALTNSIKATASVAIRNHLKAVAEKNYAIAEEYFELVKQGLLTRREAAARLRRIFLSQKVGTSGYIYCIDSHGIAVVHPNTGVESTDNTRFDFVREQIKRKEGYIEYQWQNPGEPASRPKALYMVYFKPLDWIISVSSYRDEFNTLLKPDDFNQAVLSVRFGKSGYAFVIDAKGNAIIHPVLQGVNILAGDLNVPSKFLREMLAKGTGTHEYEWKNPKDPHPRRKLAVFELIPEFGWLVVSSAYWQEVMTPVFVARWIGYGAVLALMLMGLIITYFLSGRITRPVDTMIRQLDNNGKTGDPVPLPTETGSREMDRLSREINEFLVTIDAQNKAVQKQRARYRGLFEASPDAIFLLRGFEIVDCNPATFDLFGGDAKSIIGKSLMDISAPIQADDVSSEDLASMLDMSLGEVPMQTFEWVHRALDGRLFDSEVRLKRFRLQDNKTIRVAFVRDITNRKQAEKALAESEQRYRQIFEESPVPLFMQDFSEAKKDMDQLVQSGVTDLRQYLQDNPQALRGLLSKVRLLFVNQAAADIYEAKNKDDLLKSVQDFAPAEISQHYIDQLVDFYNGKRFYEGYGRNKTSAGNVIELLIKKVVVAGYERDLSQVASMVLDLTEIKQARREKEKLESQLRQAQKMEAVGTLAGGIAHDFNNILTAIMGFTEMAQLKASQGQDNDEQLSRIVQAAEKARDLVRQILTFSRKSETQLKSIDLNELLLRSKEILERTIPKMIEIKMSLTGGLDRIKGDTNQLEQVVMNLANNASDAMPEGGVLSFETKPVLVDEEFAREHLGMKLGNYVLLTVSDTGHGMDQETIAKLFDPFFTTKEVGKGTGLGLSTVYGIVKEHQGHVYCYSELGLGTTFNIYLPVMQEEDEPGQAEESAVEKNLQGTETILLVDDESSLREVSTSLLKDMGYQVFAAANGEEALEICRREGKKIDLIVLDLGMPGMGGHRALKEIMALDPQAKVLIASGYSASSKVKDLLKDGASGFVPKPFRRLELLENVRAVLDGKAVHWQ